MKLYELTAEYEVIAELAFNTADNGEVNSELAEKLDAIETKIDEKLASCCRMVKNMQGIEEALKSEINRLQSKQRSAAKAVESIKDYMQTNMEQLGIDSRKVDSMFTVSIQASPPAVAVEDMDQVPNEFDKEPARVIDKTAIRLALQAGKQVPGCTLVQSKHLRIK
jgi:SMC interacting uncharacterized protein involved in chromosome segregation